MNIDHSQIKETISKIAATDAFQNIFGAETHQFKLHPPLTEEDVCRFERKHDVVLPEDYRGFLLNIGNGGAGPGYGLFKLGETDNGWGHSQWRENDGFAGTVALPFPHSEAWNDLQGAPDDDLEDEEEFDRRLNAFEEVYFSPAHVNGAVPVCHLGCALRRWLVVTGSERGHVWCDDRADHRGLYPFRINGQDRATFMDWYLDWLNEAAWRTLKPV